MNHALPTPSQWTHLAQWTHLGISGTFIYALILIIGISIFSKMILTRIKPLLKASPDHRFGELNERARSLFIIWLLQSRHPRYMIAGLLHIFLFAGFLILALRSSQMVLIGMWPDLELHGMDGRFGQAYGVLHNNAATWVFIAALFAMVRRGLVQPARYAVPSKYGKDHTGEAVFVLCLISTLVISDGLFEASLAAAQVQKALPAKYLPPLTLAWIFKALLSTDSIATLQWVNHTAYFIHDLTFFGFLCFLPLGKHFHVVTSLFNVWFMRLHRGNIKPVRHGISEAQLDDLEVFGVKQLEDFTWKHILDFYTCADCGRCSDNCPANSAGRPLSPRFISIKGRDLTYAIYPLWGHASANNDGLMDTIYDEDEIWSCTTCGACEQECPLGIEYIDKIVDLRRGLVDDGNVPQSLQKPLRALRKRGNPWGKLEKKRADWANEIANEVPIKILDGKKETADILFFVDSISSFDDRMQSLSQSTARILHHLEIDFGILGSKEMDSGHEVRRFGEEMLFQDLRDKNTDAILASGATRIVTADPHAFNALKNDYAGIPPVEHISQFLMRMLREGTLALHPLQDISKTYTYHDPCYLGRHNSVYDAPRNLLDAVFGLQRVDMGRSGDRSFCCGGGGLMLFYEPEEEERMGVLRIKMAAEAGADVMITACPFCLANIEDAIKVAGLEGKMEAVDLTELIAKQIL